MAAATGMMSLVLLGFVANVIAQTLIVALLYFVPFGIAAAVTGSAATPPGFGEHEGIALAACLIGGLGAFLLYRPEPGLGDSYASLLRQAEEQGRASMAPAEAVPAAATALPPASAPATPAPPPAPTVPERPDSYEQLMEDLLDVAESEIVMPAKLYEMGRRFAVLSPMERTVEVLREQLSFSENMNLRRIVQIALRFFDRPDFDPASVHDLVLAGLEDGEDWVRFDALRAGDVLGYRDDAFLAHVTAIADGMEAPPLDEQIPASDAALQARVRAARLLEKLAAA
ncbi:hypothetical protein IHV25_09505 [Phaeovibrio sulfidiphilus]|uniref:Uncharacterized protein n=1 Tax=Phaeovibrio sulfidiphilus TaxID=1220600 RepID=A0A8J7CQ60_9PROT|nr:hypothetical protein [Phaeovibrio sulfidiphilus]MBE1237877.1 hypothetical protein [Phaeovibrio sulfidiphilus]